MVCSVVTPHYAANFLQAFDASKVQPPNPDTDFTDVKANTVKLVKGRGQIVEWRGSSVTVFEKDNEGKEKGTSLYNDNNGKLEVEVGWQLYIVQGKFVEIG